MLKLVMCVRRLPDLSREEFQRYWLENHGALVRKHARAMRIRRYVQIHTLDTPLNDVLRQSRGTPEPFDGLAEIYWESLEDLMAATNSPEGRAANQELYEDEKRFIDLARSPIWAVQEHPVVEG